MNQFINVVITCPRVHREQLTSRMIRFVTSYLTCDGDKLESTSVIKTRLITFSLND